jgi:hypothetical protein
MKLDHVLTDEQQQALGDALDGPDGVHEYNRLYLQFTPYLCDSCFATIDGLTAIRPALDLPASMRGDYCPACYDAMIITHARTCEGCHKRYYEADPEIPRWLCRPCRRGPLNPEDRRVRYHLRRAQAAGRLASLTLGEWLTILDRWGWACAYCGGAYQLLDHYTPVIQNGGTTADNCLPCCEPCAARRRLGRSGAQWSHVRA